MNLVDIENGIFFLLQLFHHCLEPLLEIAPKLGARQHGSQINPVDSGIFQLLRYAALVDSGRQPIRDGRLSHTGFPHMERIVLLTPAQYLHGAFQLRLPSY